MTRLVRHGDPGHPVSHIVGLDGSDAMNPHPDYSAAYVVLTTDAGRRASRATASTFTIGRGNELCVAAIGRSAAGRAVSDVEDDRWQTSAAFWRSSIGDSQLRWLGPEKGVIHLATAAIVNAVWDLRAKRAGQAAVEAARRA